MEFFETSLIFIVILGNYLTNFDYEYVAVFVIMAIFSPSFLLISFFLLRLSLHLCLPTVPLPAYSSLLFVFCSRLLGYPRFSPFLTKIQVVPKICVFLCLLLVKLTSVIILPSSFNLLFTLIHYIRSISHGVKNRTVVIIIFINNILSLFQYSL